MNVYMRCANCGATILKAGPDSVWQHTTEAGFAVPCDGGESVAEPEGAVSPPAAHDDEGA